MLKALSIFWNSFKMSLQEIGSNKLRSGLSLIGIAFGIFCIIGVLATVSSLQTKVQSDIKALGSNVIYIDKWEYVSGATDYPWWKYVNRPVAKFSEVNEIKQRSYLAKYVAYVNNDITNVGYRSNELKNITIYGVSSDFFKMQDIELEYGRVQTQNEFSGGNPVCVIGYEIAENLFGKAEFALNKNIKLKGKVASVIGVLKKQGQSFVNIYDYDHSVITTYRFYASMFNVNSRWTDSKIMVNAKDGIAIPALIDDLEGVMRQIRRLSPRDDDNFSLNDINTISQDVNGFFGSVNAGGWAIAGLSLIVGAFGVANIMFVTVRERTSQIGLKKAIGAKSRTILTEFLLESAFLCVIGGAMGLGMVWLLALILSSVMPFQIVIAPNIILLAFSICVILGILSGIIPASIAAKMNPVVAIRSK